MGRKFVIAGLLGAAGVILSTPAAADTKAGVDAWTRGDYAAAVREWQGPADQGDGDALFNLGQAYKLGKGVPQDMAKAEAMFGRAAALGHLQAADNYGLLLFQRGEKARALPYVRAASDRGDPRAQYLLGIMHFNGDMVPKDWVRAYALVSLARQQGLAPAIPALGQMDEFIPLEQRQKGVALAAELQAQADATRARQFAAADLGVQVPSTAPAPGPVKAPPAASATVASSSPASAGADFARPKVPIAAPKSAPPPPTVRPAPAPKLAKASTPAPAPAAAPVPVGGKWRLQFGTFGVASNADALWARIARRPELAGHPRLNVKVGALTKLQAGGYSQEAAQAACARLKAAGFVCVAVPG
ncbi:MAG: SPOR domain-containing protein [Novosphingobium sp.]